jgi:hypothetical protein
MLEAYIMATTLEPEEIKQENTVKPSSIPPMLYNLSLIEVGTMSPNPVVLIVANVQYIAAMYLHDKFYGILNSFT